MTAESIPPRSFQRAAALYIKIFLSTDNYVSPCASILRQFPRQLAGWGEADGNRGQSARIYAKHLCVGRALKLSLTLETFLQHR